jgi:hypothetical protein
MSPNLAEAGRDPGLPSLRTRLLRHVLLPLG